MTHDEYLNDDGGERARQLVEAGTDLVGSVSGGAVGLVLGGPVGAIAGAAAGPAAAHSLRAGVTELSRRFLGPREKVRVGAAAIYAQQRLNAVLAAGATVRDDGFFDDLPGGRNAGREVVEGVLLKARGAWQERKVAHIGAMFANIAIYPEISDATAALALERAERLTWRQYVLLAAVGRSDAVALPALTIGTGPGPGGDWGTWGARRELMELYEGGYFTSPERKTERFGLTLNNLELDQQRLANSGHLMHDLLLLADIPDEDVLAAQAELIGDSS